MWKLIAGLILARSQASAIGRLLRPLPRGAIAVAEHQFMPLRPAQ
jgi:hypothetical protein